MDVGVIDCLYITHRFRSNCDRDSCCIGTESRALDVNVTGVIDAGRRDLTYDWGDGI